MRIVGAVLLLVALLAGGLASWPCGALAQSDQSAEAVRAWEDLGDTAAALLRDGEAADTQALEDLRERLVVLRSETLAAQEALRQPVAALEARLQALGPPPEAGVDEPADIGRRRAALTQELTEARAPLLVASDAYRRAGQQIAEIDRILVARLAGQLLARGPTPLNPAAWLEAGNELAATAARYRAAASAALADPVVRERILRRVPAHLLMVLAGLAIAFTWRQRAGAWIERRLAGDIGHRLAAWLVALRNLNRLILPTVGAGLLIAALDPGRLAEAAPQRVWFHLPDFVWLLIGAGWLAGSLFAPHTSAHRLVPVEDALARGAARLVLAMGLLLAGYALLRDVAAAWSLSPAAVAVLGLPLSLASSLALWRAAAAMTAIRASVTSATSGAGSHEDQQRLPDRLVETGARLVWTAALIVPLAAVAGYAEFARFLAVGTMLTLALVGAANVIYDLLIQTVASLVPRRRALPGVAPARPVETGLLPVLVAAVVVAVCLPVLALVWGARPADLADALNLLHEGLSIGGMRLSLGAVLRFALVFALVFGIARLLQSVLRVYVLPRTRLDAGGRNAILAGVGYSGFAAAVLVAVSAAGLDLSNLAIVAGALSVGIGFGLQTMVANFVSGIILLVERPIKEGDWIEVEGFSGYVRDISVRSTRIETFDRASVIVPNQDLIAGTVLNRTHVGMSGRLIVPVGVAYDSDPRHVERVLLAVAEENPLVLAEPPPTILFMGFGADAMNFEIRCRLRDVNYMLTVQSEMNFRIVERFREEGIAIPFPQRDVHVHGLEALGRTADGGSVADDAGPAPLKPVRRSGGA